MHHAYQAMLRGVHNFTDQPFGKVMTLYTGQMPAQKLPPKPNPGATGAAFSCQISPGPPLPTNLCQIQQLATLPIKHCSAYI